MSEDEEPTNADALPDRVRTVTPLTGYGPNATMDVFGWLIFLGLLVVLVPLLPFILIVWVITRVDELVTGEP